MTIILPCWTELPRDELCFGLRLQVVLLPWQHNPKWQKVPVRALRLLWKFFGHALKFPFSLLTEIFCSNGRYFDHLTSMTTTGIFLSFFKKGFFESRSVLWSIVSMFLLLLFLDGGLNGLKTPKYNLHTKCPKEFFCFLATVYIWAHPSKTAWFVIWISSYIHDKIQLAT